MGTGETADSDGHSDGVQPRLLAGCAAGRPTGLIRLPQGHDEALTAHCEAQPPESCTPVRVTGDPRDEEAWGFRARPVINALWKEPEVFCAVGDRTRRDQVRAVLGTRPRSAGDGSPSDGSRPTGWRPA